MPPSEPEVPNAPSDAAPSGGSGTTADGSAPTAVLPERDAGPAGSEERSVWRTIHELPKAELHVHLDGSLRPGTVVELADEHGVELPERDPQRLADYLYVRNAENLEDYLARFEVTTSVMQHSGALERVAYELCEDAAEENVRYLEIRYSPILLTEGGLPLPETVEAPLRGIERARNDHGVEAKLIICGIRNMDPDVSRDLADLTIAFRDRGVVAFDLAGAEYNYPAKKHKNAFYMVRNANVNATIHAGEAYGPESIHQALHYCGAHRIGHGTRLHEDEDLTRYIRDHRIPLEICLTSNVQTRAVTSFEEHPVREYFDRGLVVSLHTDNRLMSHTTVTDEYFRAWKHLDFDLEEIADMVIAGFRSAFLTYDRKKALLQDAIPSIRDRTDSPLKPETEVV